MIISKPAYATGTDIVSLADMKEFLRVDHSDEDTTITSLLDAASAHISDYCNRHFAAGGSTVFYLSKWRTASLAFGPVTGVQAIRYSDSNGDTQTLAASKYYFETLTDNTTRISFHDTPDLEDYNATPVIITCVAGKVPSASVEVATKLLVTHWYENRRAVVTGTTATEMPMSVRSLLSSERIIDLRQ